MNVLVGPPCKRCGSTNYYADYDDDLICLMCNMILVYAGNYIVKGESNCFQLEHSQANNRKHLKSLQQIRDSFVG
jgi:hypothetical protein